MIGCEQHVHLFTKKMNKHKKKMPQQWNWFILILHNSLFEIHVLTFRFLLEQIPTF